MNRAAALLLLGTAGLAMAQHGHQASGPPGKLTVTAASTSGASGQEAEVVVQVKGAASLGALEFVLVYDPAVLEARSADKGTLLGKSLIEYYADPSGRLAVVLASQDAVSGDGPAAKAKFLVKGQPGQKSSLKLESVRAWDGKTHLDFLVAIEAGEFTVASAGWPWWWFAAAGGAALLLILAWLARRKQQSVAGR